MLAGESEYNQLARFVDMLGQPPDDMLDDVGSALRWVRENRSSLAAPDCEPAKVQIFGGYSSGGHVAASLLQRPDKLKQWGLPPLAAGYDGVAAVAVLTEVGNLILGGGFPVPVCK